MIPGLAFSCAFLLALGLIPLVRGLILRLGSGPENRLVYQPRQDRWHRSPTPTLGGVGIGAAALGGFLLSAWWGGADGVSMAIPWGVLMEAALMFGLGLWDDLRPLTPPVKLGGQFLAATLVVALGYSTQFFSPRVDNPLLAQALNILLTIFWLVGITNATNLLDNMDGLAGGIAGITALILSYFFWQSGDMGLLGLSLAVTGAAFGFLVFNFPPARIFMGDSGSQFLGFTLALLAIARKPQASNVFAVLGVPTLIFLLPILDTTLVTFTRLLRGQSPAQGGRDHTSHRLIAFGLSERQAVLALYGVAALSGLLAAGLEALTYWFSLVLVPPVILALALLTAYLGGLKVTSADRTTTAELSPASPQGEQATSSPLALTISHVLLELTYRRRVLEVILDVFMIGLVYYLAILTRYGLVMNEMRLELYLRSLPLALGCAYLAALLAGVYRGVWRYIGFAEMARYLQAAFGSMIFLALGVFLLSETRLVDWSPAMSPVVYFLFGIYLFLGYLATRSSFRFFDNLSRRQVVGRGQLAAVEAPQRIAIYGAGDAGELALRWSWTDGRWQVVAFFDENPLRRGREIHGIEVVGGWRELERAIHNWEIQGIVVAAPDPAADFWERAVVICRERGVWVKRFSIHFDAMDSPDRLA